MCIAAEFLVASLKGFREGAGDRCTVAHAVALKGGEAEGGREQVRREQQAAQFYPKGTEIMEGFYRYN